MLETSALNSQNNFSVISNFNSFNSSIITEDKKGDLDFKSFTQGAFKDFTTEEIDKLSQAIASQSSSFEDIFILNTLPTINIRATDAVAAEVNAGQTANPGRFTFTRTGNLNAALTVNYTIGGTATRGSDYNNLTGTVSFRAGSAEAIVDINPINDTLFEGSESVILTLANSSAYTLGANRAATVTITDNDLPTVTIAASDATAAEVNAGQTPNPGRFTLTRTGNVSNALTVNYTVAGTAGNGGDYNRLTGTLTFAAGSATAIVDINPINDTTVEPNETVILTLANHTGYVLGANRAATVTITDNDIVAPPVGGAVQWTQQFSYQPSLLEAALDIVTADDGSFYATGWMGTSITQGGNGTDDAWVAKYSPTGQQLWIRSISTPNHYSQSGGTTYFARFHERAYGIGLDRAGNVFVTGTRNLEGFIAHENDPTTPDDNTSEPLEGSDIFLYKYSPTGTLLIQKADLTGSNNETARDIAIDGAGNAYVVGSYDGYAALYKYDGNSGNLLWGQGLSNDTKDVPASVAVDSQGFVYVAGDYDRPFNNGTTGGFGNTNSSYDAWLVKCSPVDGSIEWVRTNLANTRDWDDRVTSLVVDNSGRVYVVGNTTTGQYVQQRLSQSAWLLQYDTQGNKGWTRTLNNTSTLAYTFTDVAVDNNNGVYVSAARTDEIANMTQAAVLKYNSSNVLQWEGKLGTAGSVIIPYAVAVARDGGVYIAGQAKGSLSRPVTGEFDVFTARFSNNVNALTFGTSAVVEAEPVSKARSHTSEVESKVSAFSTEEDTLFNSLYRYDSSIEFPYSLDCCFRDKVR